MVMKENQNQLSNIAGQRVAAVDKQGIDTKGPMAATAKKDPLAPDVKTSPVKKQKTGPGPIKDSAPTSGPQEKEPQPSPPGPDGDMLLDRLASDGPDDFLDTILAAPKTYGDYVRRRDAYEDYKNVNPVNDYVPFFEAYAKATGRDPAAKGDEKEAGYLESAVFGAAIELANSGIHWINELTPADIEKIQQYPGENMVRDILSTTVPWVAGGLALGSPLGVGALGGAFALSRGVSLALRLKRAATGAGKLMGIAAAPSLHGAARLDQGTGAADDYDSVAAKVGSWVTGNGWGNYGVFKGKKVDQLSLAEKFGLIYTANLVDETLLMGAFAPSAVKKIMKSGGGPPSIPGSAAKGLFKKSEPPSVPKDIQKVFDRVSAQTEVLDSAREDAAKQIKKALGENGIEGDVLDTVDRLEAAAKFVDLQDAMDTVGTSDRYIKELDQAWELFDKSRVAPSVPGEAKRDAVESMEDIVTSLSRSTNPKTRESLVNDLHWKILDEYKNPQGPGVQQGIKTKGGVTRGKKADPAAVHGSKIEDTGSAVKRRQRIAVRLQDLIGKADQEGAPLEYIDQLTNVTEDLFKATSLEGTRAAGNLQGMATYKQYLNSLRRIGYERVRLQRAIREARDAGEQMLSKGEIRANNGYIKSLESELARVGDKHQKALNALDIKKPEEAGWGDIFSTAVIDNFVGLGALAKSFYGTGSVVFSEGARVLARELGAKNAKQGAVSIWKIVPNTLGHLNRKVFTKEGWEQTAKNLALGTRRGKITTQTLPDDASKAKKAVHAWASVNLQLLNSLDEAFREGGKSIYSHAAFLDTLDHLGKSYSRKDVLKYMDLAMTGDKGKKLSGVDRSEMAVARDVLSIFTKKYETLQDLSTAMARKPYDILAETGEEPHALAKFMFWLHENGQRIKGSVKLPVAKQITDSVTAFSGSAASVTDALTRYTPLGLIPDRPIADTASLLTGDLGNVSAVRRFNQNKILHSTGVASFIYQMMEEHSDNPIADQLVYSPDRKAEVQFRRGGGIKGFRFGETFVPREKMGIHGDAFDYWDNVSSKFRRMMINGDQEGAERYFQGVVDILDDAFVRNSWLNNGMFLWRQMLTSGDPGEIMFRFGSQFLPGASTIRRVYTAAKGAPPSADFFQALASEVLPFLPDTEIKTRYDAFGSKWNHANAYIGESIEAGSMETLKDVSKSDYILGMAGRFLNPHRKKTSDKEFKFHNLMLRTNAYAQGNEIIMMTGEGPRKIPRGQASQTDKMYLTARMRKASDIANFNEGWTYKADFDDYTNTLPFMTGQWGEDQENILRGFRDEVTGMDAGEGMLMEIQNRRYSSPAARDQAIELHTARMESAEEFKTDVLEAIDTLLSSTTKGAVASPDSGEALSKEERDIFSGFVPSALLGNPDADTKAFLVEMGSIESIKDARARGLYDLADDVENYKDAYMESLMDKNSSFSKYPKKVVERFAFEHGLKEVIVRKWLEVSEGDKGSPSLRRKVLHVTPSVVAKRLRAILDQGRTE